MDAAHRTRMQASTSISTYSPAPTPLNQQLTASSYVSVVSLITSPLSSSLDTRRPIMRAEIDETAKNRQKAFFAAMVDDVWASVCGCYGCCDGCGLMIRRK